MRKSGRIHQLSEEAQNLYQVAMQGDGIVRYNELEQGYFLQVNGKNYITSQDSKEVEANKVAAMKELRNAGLLTFVTKHRSGLLTLEAR
jgi:hypothetical protein